MGHKRPVKTRWPAVRGITEKARTRSPPSGTKPRDGFYGPAEAAGDGNRYIRPMTLLGYARVSTDDQSASLQQDALSAAGCWKTFTDVGSGARASRPELDRLIDQLRPGDTVVVWRLDRLGRSIQHLIEQLKVFEEMGVEFRSLQENIDTSTSGGRLVFHIFASLAEFERDLIKERTQAGLQAARARGRVGGRKPKLSDAQARTVRQLYDARELTVEEIGDLFGVSRKTVYRTLARDENSRRRRDQE